MKLLRICVPDPNAPGFREEAERQAALLRGSPEEAEAMAFIEAAAAWPEEPYDWVSETEIAPWVSYVLGAGR